MQKPNNYAETSTGEYTPIELGGHLAVVKRVEETTSKSGKPMIKVAIDFDANDSQPGYFMAAFKADVREDKKWPYLATQYIMSEDQDGKCSRAFKSFITAVEKSNNSECAWGEGFEKWFTGKKVGVMYGEVEEEYNGEIKTRRRIRFFTEYDKAKFTEIPEKKLMKPKSGFVNSTPDFMNVNGTEEEIPF